MFSINEDKTLLGYQLLRSCSNVQHFVTTRQGGYSVGRYESFNCSPFSGDIPGRVKRNQEFLCDLLEYQPDELIIPYQQHATEIAVINQTYAGLSENGKELFLHGVDSLITNIPGYCLCILTADCVPVMLYDNKKNVIAVVHAGWRGTVNRLVAKTISEMQVQFGSRPADIIACIGPSICVSSFEVGNEVYHAFAKEGFDMDLISYFENETGKYHIDLWEANHIQLIGIGVLPENIELSGICSYIYYEQFFSARRLGRNSGRTLSGIMLKNV